MDLKLISIKKANDGKHKLVAKFKKGDKEINTKFGAVGYSDFTIHHDIERKDRYLARHKKNEKWNDPTTAGALSRWILWNKPSFSASLADYKKRFNV